MILKPTIVDGEWRNLPPPPQDAEWLKSHGLSKPLPPIKPVTETKNAGPGNRHTNAR